MVLTAVFSIPFVILTGIPKIDQPFFLALIANSVAFSLAILLYMNHVTVYSSTFFKLSLLRKPLVASEKAAISAANIHIILS